MSAQHLTFQQGVYIILSLCWKPPLRGMEINKCSISAEEMQGETILAHTEQSDVSICNRYSLINGGRQNHLRIHNKFRATNVLSVYQGKGCISILALWWDIRLFVIPTVRDGRKGPWTRSFFFFFFWGHSFFTTDPHDEMLSGCNLLCLHILFLKNSLLEP